MTASELAVATGTGDDRTPPLDILYLDRPRLTSYASQLYDGEPIQRQIRDLKSYMKEFVGGAVDEETSASNTTGGLAGVNAGVQLNAKALQVKANVQRKRGGHHATQRSELSEEHTTLNVRDNLLVAFLDDMRDRGWLRDLDLSDDTAGLIEVTGAMRFMDWTMVQELLANWHSLNSAIEALKGEKSGVGGFNKETAKTIGQFTSMMGIGGFHLHMNAGDDGLIAPLASQHLTLTREQMFVNYLRDEPIEGTLIAFHNPSRSGEGPGSGLASVLQFGSLLDSFLGKSVRLLPLAVYFSLSGK